MISTSRQSSEHVLIETEHSCDTLSFDLAFDKIIHSSCFYWLQNFGCRGSCGCNGGSSSGGSNPGNTFYSGPQFSNSNDPQQRPRPQYALPSFPSSSGPQMPQREPTYRSSERSFPSTPRPRPSQGDSLFSLFNGPNTGGKPSYGSDPSSSYGPGSHRPVFSSDSSSSYGPDNRFPAFASDSRNSGNSYDRRFPFPIGK